MPGRLLRPGLRVSGSPPAMPAMLTPTAGLAFDALAVLQDALVALGCAIVATARWPSWFCGVLKCRSARAFGAVAFDRPS